ncbi:MAG: YfhO family protein [Planctomycetales bacterium]|nr:YfhO family protein [Planctomycetales bacterium]
MSSQFTVHGSPSGGPDFAPRPEPGSEGRVEGSPRRTTILVFLAYSVLALVLARAALRPGFVLGSLEGDVVRLFVPWWEFSGRSLGEGVFPLWNPGIFAGTPFHAGMQGGLLYPTTWLAALLPVPLAITLHVLLHLVLAAAGARAWAAARGVGPAGAALAGLVYGFSWCVLGQAAAGHVPQVAGIAWLPWVILAGERALAAASRGLRAALPPVAAAGAALGAGILAGHPQYPWIAAFGLGWLAIAAAARRTLAARAMGPRAGLAALPPLAVLAAVAAAAFGVSAAQLLPALAYLPESARSGGLAPEIAASYHLPARHLPLALAPGFLGPLGDLANHWGDVTWWGRWNPWDGLASVGALPFLLLPCAALVSARRRSPSEGAQGSPVDLRGLALLAAAGLALALGPETPLHGFACQAFPGLGGLRAPARFAALAALPAAVAAGAGLDALLRPGDEGRRAGRRLGAVAAAVALLAGAGVAVLLLTGPTGGPWRAVVGSLFSPNDLQARDLREAPGFLAAAHREAVRALLGLAGVASVAAVLGTYRALGSAGARALAGSALALAAADMAWCAGTALPAAPAAAVRLAPAVLRDLPSDPASWRFVHVGGTPNQGMPLGLLALDGYEANLPRRAARLLARSEGRPPDAPMFALPLSRPGAAWDAAAVRVALAAAPRPGQPWVEPAIRALEASPQWRPAGRYAVSTVFRNDGAPSRARLVGRARRAASEDEAVALVADGATDPRAEAVLVGEEVTLGRPGAAGDARVLSETPNRVEVAARAEREALLVLADSWDPGWRATVDGAPAPVLLADAAFRAVSLLPGEHRVVFEYRAPGLVPGCALTLATLAALLGLVLATRRASDQFGVTAPGPAL